MSNPSDAWHPLPSQAETKSQETAEEADFDKELTDSKKEKVGCGCLGELFLSGVARCLLGLRNVMDLAQKRRTNDPKDGFPINFHESCSTRLRFEKKSV